MSSRFIDPRRHVERAIEEDHGLLTARELSHQIDTGNRIDADFDRNQRFIPSGSIEVYRPKPVANTVDQQMGHLIVTGPTNQVGLILRDVEISQQSRLTHVQFIASQIVTAGSIVPKIMIVEPDHSSAIDIQLDELVLDSALNAYGFQTASKSVFFDWQGALQIARDQRWRILLDTDAAYAPTTNDFKAVVTFSVEQWI